MRKQREVTEHKY